MKKSLRNRAWGSVIGYGIIVSLIFFLLMPAINSWIVEQSVIVNFIVFYFLIFFIVSGVLLLILGENQKKKRDYVKIFKMAIGITFIVMAIDLVLPSYALDWNGAFLPSSTIGYFGAIDYVIASFWNWLRVSGILLAVLTYPVTGMIFLFLALEILGTTNFIKNLRQRL